MSSGCAPATSGEPFVRELRALSRRKPSADELLDATSRTDLTRRNLSSDSPMTLRANACASIRARRCHSRKPPSTVADALGEEPVQWRTRSAAKQTRSYAMGQLRASIELHNQAHRRLFEEAGETAELGRNCSVSHPAATCCAARYEPAFAAAERARKILPKREMSCVWRGWKSMSETSTTGRIVSLKRWHAITAHTTAS